MYKKFQIVRWMAFVVFSILTTNAAASDWLFKNGHSNYTIVLSSNASLSEQTATRELQDYLYKISGVRLPIIHEGRVNGRNIFVGYSKEIAVLTNQPKPADDDESFTYRKVGHNLLIWGGKQKGTMYGVYTFLEKELGVHWLAPDSTVIPRHKKFRLKKIDHSETPAIRYRYNNYYVTRNSPAWSAHLKENMRGLHSKDYGDQYDYWGCHTMGQLIPVREFYKSHPEYFCLRNNKRLSSEEQLCLSNPDVLQLCKERLATVMRDNPQFLIYSLSQNDNYNFCQCEHCVAIENQYGGHSGLIVWFVNQVADALCDEFPGKYIGTFAYQYSQKPPDGIKPRDNVVIRLCSTGCCFAHPIESECTQNTKFMNDLRGWASIAPHLFIWDYVVDFAQYLAPWPNFQVLAPNIRTFRDNNAIGIFEEATFSTLGGEFEELKSWVINQLLWNPEQDTDSLVSIFIYGFYGKAAKDVLKYYHLCKSLVSPDIHMGIFIRDDHKVYTDDFLKKAFSILDNAQKKADSNTIKQRVERVRLQPLYLYCMRNREQSKIDGKWDELLSLMRKYNTRPSSSLSLDQFSKLK